VSQASADDLLDSGAVAERVRVIPNGVDLEAFEQAEPFCAKRLDHPRIGYIGRISRDRGLGVFQALAERGIADVILVGEQDDPITASSSLHVQLSVPHCDVPKWYDTLDEQSRWNAQARFWEAVAARCAKSPAIFCYDLMNEPILPGKQKPETDWLAGEFGGKHFVQRIALDLAGRTRDLSQRLATLKKGSNLRAHWESEISKMMDQVETFNEAKGEGAYWRKLALALEQCRLQSENWHLSDRPYAVAADSSLRRISGNHPGFTFRGSAGGEVYLQAGINEYESFQLVILPRLGVPT